eukprot:CAMPEP_0202413574 /NCGR_PEP_ID=MMETSP1128-20130828/29955_1 /ASSEMBLY_ACC=CAM_ASM_000463 /TAXON_ID=3047 /ORGANISM="Dunaliella tertiolecta, Strain CCMP1320" /LENGTH=337 /DNA_ID=CAMNT_0049019767 /DNA_START=63 /DNA_END=1073 /DNA_ORIENTATION=-
MGRKRSQPAWMRDNSYECANDAVPKREQAVAGPAVAGPAVARGLAAAVTEPLQVAGGEGEELTPYELERQALIARNRQRMFELGIPMAAQELSAISASSKAKAAPKASKPKPKEQPAKRSKRISGEKAPGKSLPEDYKENDEDELVEEKPKKKVSRKPSASQATYPPRHPTLPSHYSGVQSIQLTSEEMKQQEVMRAVDQRMAAIKLDGLIDWTDQKAVFVVKGSRGDNYLVSISDNKNTCQCMDHRIRKRDCKHIMLIQTQLGLNKYPISWKQAVHDKFMLSSEERVQKGLQAIAESMGLSSAPPATGAGGPGNVYGTVVKAEDDGLARGLNNEVG